MRQPWRFECLLRLGRLEEAVALLTSSISHKCAKRGIRGVLTTSPLASSGAQGPKHVGSSCFHCDSRA